MQCTAMPQGDPRGGRQGESAKVQQRRDDGDDRTHGDLSAASTCPGVDHTMGHAVVRDAEGETAPTVFFSARKWEGWRVHKETAASLIMNG